MSEQTLADRVQPRRLFYFFAFAEMCTWAGLIISLILRGLEVVNIVPVAGGLHGFVFLSYATTTVFVWVNQKWRFDIGITALLLAIVPFATVPFKLVIDRRGLLQGQWRLRPGGDAPKGVIEHVQAWVLRYPVLAILLLFMFVAVLFITLLWLGPPVPMNSPVE